ncbi:hypothetical protein ARMGADRAFT_595559 [Armillaria gallica]|uniref:Uncharacterized protein n=1 Tax=Armillaria gallica TaxID=47427 RepID=A0A2H3CP21_ARMGA|nr:hypothetical protein ARMGADRAFT_595559 [Armillaria gallica]
MRYVWMRTRPILGRLSFGKNCVGINHYCNGDGHFVLPTATSNTCRRPCLGALDSGEGFRRSSVGGTDSASLTLVERPVPSPLPMSCAPSLNRSNDYQPGHIEKAIGRAPLKGIDAAAWTTDTTANVSSSIWMPCNGG